MNRKRLLCALAAMIGLCGLLLFPALGQAAEDTSRVRVLLKRLNIADRLDLRLDGIYSVGNPGEASMVFAPGSELTVSLKEGHLYVYYQGLSWNAGASLYFTRYQRPDGQENGLRLQGGNNLYEGDLQLNAQTEGIQAILHIEMEDYLLGVVPYEMSDSFPLEALKAQAVAARTYAARKLDSSRNFDVVDTTNDQVFKGKNAAHAKAIRAVTETQGMLLYHGGRLAQCYYTASNGGQTEKVSNVWGGEDLPYLVCQDDPYDLANPFSVIKHFRLPKQAENGLSPAVTQVLAPHLTNFLSQQGYDHQAENIRIDQVLSASLSQPKYEGSRIMTRLTLEIRLSAKRRIIPLAQADDEVMLFTSPSPIPSPIPTQAPTVSYTEFVPVSQPATLILSLPGALEQAMDLSINSGENEIITLEETADAFVFSSRRYGHGVGMSQRGAEWMAGHEQMTYQQILSFYYPGTELRQANQRVQLPALDPQRLATPGPRPTATPRPTLMPVTQALPQGAWYATVTEISDDSSLNLRSEPNTDCDILLRLYKGQKLIVLEKCQEEGWLKVKTDTAEGYVMASFLTQEQPGHETAAAP